MSTTGSDVACPDPSVHSQFSRNADLQNNASKAALLAAEHKRSESQPKTEISALGPDGKLSAAGAATSLKYAKPTDLPSFPVVGIDSASGNTAANLANSNQKSFEWWKPEASSNAGKAAALANKDGGKVNLWEYKPDGTGNSAAHLAMGKSSSPQLDYGYTDEGRKNALKAAAMSTRKKPEPTFEAPPPEMYPDSGNASYNALNAATSVAGNRRTAGDTYRMSDRAMEASRYTHAKGISRDMYGDKPPVELEQEEKRHAAAIRASAVVMAKKLYEIEKPQMEAIGAGDIAARKMHEQQYGASRAQPSSDPLKAQAMNYLKVQEAAQKLAAERLAKLDPDGVLAYREHYGYGRPAPSESKLAIRNRERRSQSKSQDDDLDSSDDEAQAARIRSRTRGLNDQVVSVDEAKRTTDRANLLAAAQRSVQARMQDMDERVFAETGKVSPAMMAEWEAKARAKAEANSNERMVTHGKVHIGGGKYMDQSEIDAIAQARLQPTLDELAENAEQQRVREAEIKADQERRAEEARVEKERQADMKAQAKMLDNQEKARKQAEKDAEKAEKRRLKDEEKEKAREEKERSKRDKEIMKAHLAEEKAEREELEKQRKAQAKTEAEEERERVVAEKKEKQEAEKEAKEEAEREAAEEAAEKKEAEEEAKQEEVIASPVDQVQESSAAAAEREEMHAEVAKNDEEVSPGRAAAPVATSPPTSPTKKKGLLARMGLKKSKASKSVESAEVGTPIAAASAVSGASPVVDIAPDATLDAEKFKSGNKEEESEELQARAKGKERAESVSSLSSDVEPTKVATNDENETWSEAKDKPDEEVKPTTSNRDSISKFQEEL